MAPRPFLAVALLAALAGAAAAEEGHRAYPHHTLGAFIGDTHQDERGDGATVGVEYEYRLSEELGFGAIYEHVWGEFDTNIYVLPVAVHSGPWKLYAGPGIESSDHGNETMLRLGVEYGFHAGEVEISPQLDLDLVDGEHLFVFGLVFAVAF
jgi:hypothetical protein